MQTPKSIFTRSYRGNIPKFFLAHGLYNCMLFLPIWVIYLQRKHNLSLTQVTLVDFAFWMTMALTEVPTGAVADTVGRKHSHGIGLVLSAGSILLFALAPTYPLLLLANSVWAIAITFISGADMALFYDTLRELGREDEYPRLRGLLTTVAVSAAGLSGVLGGLLTSWHPASPFLLYAGLLVLTFFVVLGFKEPPREPDPATGKQLAYKQTLKMAWRTLRQSPNLRYALLYSNLLPVAGAAVQITFIQPHAIAIGIPLALMGFVTFGINLIRIAGASNANRFAQRLGERRWLAVASVMMIAGVIGLGAVDAFGGLAVFALAAFAAPAVRPLVESIILRHTPGSIRATILSVDNLIFRLLLAGLEPFVGRIADTYSLPTAFVVLGVGVGLGLAAVLGLWGRAGGAEAN